MSYLTTLLLPILMCLCFLGFIAIVGGGIFFFINRSAKAVNSTWGDLGITAGLKLKPGAMFSQPELNGEFRQRPIRVQPQSVVDN